VCFVIIKAREFDAKDIVTEPETASNPSDDRMIAVLEDHRDDPVLEELTSFISNLSEDEQIDLVTLAWLGRDDNSREDWFTLRKEAAHTLRAPRTRPTICSACRCSATFSRRVCRHSAFPVRISRPDGSDRPDPARCRGSPHWCSSVDDRYQYAAVFITREPSVLV